MKNRNKDIIQLISIFIIIILINIIGSMVYHRFDLTQEGRYSLSKASKKLLSEIDDYIYIEVYLEGDFPSGIERLSLETKQILSEFKTQNDFIQFTFINPTESKDDNTRNEILKQLYEKGLNPTNLQIKNGDSYTEKIILPGAILKFGANEIAVQLLKNQIGSSSDQNIEQSIRELEYEFTNAIKQLRSSLKPSIAFLKGHGELDGLDIKDLRNTLTQQYSVDEIDLREFELDSVGKPNLKKKLRELKLKKLLLIAKPKSTFENLDKYFIDQYIMNGGKTMWFLDGVAMDMDSLKGNAPFSMAVPLDLNLTDLLFKYGVRVNYDLVMDFQSDQIPIIVGYQGNIPQQQLVPWFYHPVIIPKNKQSIVKNLDGIKSAFVSTLDTVKAINIKKTPLLFSSPYSKIVRAPHRVSLQILEQEPNIKQFNAGEKPIAYLLEGEFQSVFQNRIAPNNESLKPKLASPSNKMIVFGDGDIIKNHVSSSDNAFPLGYNQFSKSQYNGNKQLIVNALNYLMDNENLINIRAKEVKLRLLNKSEIKNNRLKWQLINTLLPIVIIIQIILVFGFVRKRKFR